jgi:copper chaperone
MVTFQVPDMTCGRCASAIARAIAAVDTEARLEIRIQDKQVRVTSSAPNAELADAIRGAGYTPREVREGAAASPQPRASRGCGCGCGTRTRTVVARPSLEALKSWRSRA